LRRSKRDRETKYLEVQYQVGLRKCSAVDQDVADLVQEKKFLPPMQLIFFSDTEVFLHSLVGDKGLNHKKGKILGYYADKDRYAVQVEAREKFALIKPDNDMPVRMIDAFSVYMISCISYILYIDVLRVR
jgi:hypothetical protein